MQKADLRFRAAVFSTIFQSRFSLPGPTASPLQRRYGRGKLPAIRSLQSKGWWVAAELPRVPPRF